MPEKDGLKKYVGRKDTDLKTPKKKFDLPGYPAGTVYIHHGASFTPTDLRDADGDGAPDAEENVWRAYQRYHMESRGWTDIAYNFGVGQSGVVYGGRGWERQGGATGSPHDAKSISICAIGNFEKKGPTKAMVEGIVDHIVRGINRGHLKKNVKIRGHRDASGQKTSCPGKNLYAMIDEIQTKVDRRISGAEAAPPPASGVEARLSSLEARVAELEGRQVG